jgi:hypothetical protein
MLDTTLLWTNLGISLLVLVLPAYFDLPLKTALAATLVGAVIGNAMLAVAALIGADARVPTMVLQRAPLGRRGSYLATALKHPQCLGWAVFELIVIATAAGLLCNKLFGFEAVWLWKLVFGGWQPRSPCSARSASCAASSASSRSGPSSRRWSTSPGGSSTAPTSTRSGRRADTTARSGSRWTPSWP